MDRPRTTAAASPRHPTTGEGGAVAGVDAGGSHTDVVVADRALTVLARATGPSGAVSGESLARSVHAIRETLGRALRDAGLNARPAGLVVGAAGAGRARERETLTRALADLADRVRVTTDGEIALEAAFGPGAGIVVVAGTGSIAFARNTAGDVWRVGGLGWQLGDEGSGYALARAALSAVGKAVDGRGRATALTEPIIVAAGCDSMEALVRWAAAAPRERVAALAAVVCETATGGDAVARRIVDEAAAELAGHVRALRARFPATGRITVAAAGGLLRRPSVVRAALAEKLEALGGVMLAEDEVDAAFGAARMARRLTQ